MGLFNSYLKPGPGVEKDAPKKKGIFLYFELLKRKFFKIMQGNMLFFVASIPLILLVYVFAPVGNIASLVGSEPNITETDIITLEHSLRCMLSMLVLTLFGSGPASAGFAYILRCVTREEHAWIFSDFKSKFKENFKQSMIVALINIVVLPLAVNAVIYYYQIYIATSNLVFMLLLYVMLLMCVIWSFMHIYIYQLMITYDCKIRDLYKNSFLLAVAKLPLNLILTAISVFLIYLVYSYLEATFATLLFLLVIYGLVRFPLEFYASRTVVRLIENTPKGENEQ